MTSAVAFKDRREGGLHLAERLRGLKLRNAVVYALPRGGVPVGLEVARALSCPLDLVFVHKIGAPGAKDMAAAAVVEGSPPLIVRNDDVIHATRATDAYLERETQRALSEIERRREHFLGGRAPISPKGRAAIVVDDGLATGATALAAVRALRAQGADRIVVAAPVASPGAVDRLAWLADAVICPVQPQIFHGVGGFYADFHQLDDSEVMELLTEAAALGQAA